VIDRAAGLMLGAVTSIGIASDYVVNALSAIGAARGTFTVVTIAVLAGCWLLVKVSARRSWLAALRTSAGALLVAFMLSLALDPYDTIFPTLVSLVALRWLVIDVVAFTADSTGLLDALLPKR
jgi:hypothetical protein